MEKKDMKKVKDVGSIEPTLALIEMEIKARRDASAPASRRYVARGPGCPDIKFSKPIGNLCCEIPAS